MNIIPIEYKLDSSNVTEILPKRSYHTHLKYSKPCRFILQKLKNPPDGFFTHLFFASAIILIFCGLFLYRLYRLLKSHPNLIRVPKTDSARKKCRTRTSNPNSSNPSWKARKNPPKGHTKNRPFFLKKFKG